MTNILKPNLYATETTSSPNWKVSSGMVAKVSDSPGAQIITIAQGGKLDLDGASGANTFIFEGLASSDVEVYRSGTEAYFRVKASGETIASIPVVATGQTIRFTDGDQILVLSGSPKLNGVAISADSVAPSFVSASVSGASLVLTYNEELNGANLPLASAFTIKVNGAPLASTAYGVTKVDGKQLVITLTSAVAAGAAVTVAYSDPTTSNDAKAIQDIYGNDVATLAEVTAGNTLGSVTDTTAPSAPTISTASSTINSTSQTIAGTAEANSMVSVYDGATLLGTAMANGSGAFSFSATGLSQSAHSITAKATDAAGNVSAASSAITLTVDSIAPSAPFISTTSATINSTSQSIAGTAEANSTVSVYDGATLLGTATANGSGAFSFSATGLSQSAHSITAKAADAAGNVSAASQAITLTVDTTAPTVSSIAYGVNDGSLALGETVTFIATMSEAVTVTGTPTLALANGGTANYTGGTGTNTLTFSYTPAAGQVTPDLATATTSALTGTIVDMAGNAVVATGFTNVNPTGTLAVDVTAPVFQSAATTVDGSKVVLTYAEALSATTAAASAFAVTVGGTARTVSSVLVNGSTAELTLATPIANGQAVTVAYTDPTGGNDANALQDLAGNDSVTLAATSVVNNVPVPVAVQQEPVLLVNGGVYTATSGVDTFVIDASQTMAATINGFASGDILQIANRTPAQGINILDTAYGNGHNQLTAGVAVIALNGLSTDGFMPSEAGFESTFGANAVQYNDAIAPSLIGAYTSTNGLKISLQFSEVLSPTTAAANAFAVNVANAARAVSSVAINGSTVELTLASAVATGQTVTVAYTASTASALTSNAAVQDASGNDASSLTARSVSNLVPAAGTDNTAPVLKDTVVLQDGSILLTFSESISSSTLEAADFSVKLEGNVALSVATAAIKGVANHQILLTLDRPIRQVDVLSEVAYNNVGAAGSVRDAAGNVAISQLVSGADILNLSTGDTPGAVQISGTATQGQTLSALLSDVDGVSTHVSYQWFAGSNAVVGATASSLMLSQEQINQAINVQVSYIDAAGHVATVSGIATASVANAQLQGSVVITGSQVEGQILTAVLSDADGVDEYSTRYQWYADGSAISGATSATFAITSTYVSKQISVSAAYTDGDNVSSTVMGSPANRQPGGTLGISGTLEENQSLTAINQITDLDGIASAMAYQWKASTDGVTWSNIAGATTGVLSLSDESLVGKHIQVVASYTDNGGHQESVIATAGASGNTYATVNNVNDAPLVSGVANGYLTLNGVGANGQPDEAEALSVNTSGIADADGLAVFAYQWFIDGAKVQDSSVNSFTVPTGKSGKGLYANVVYVDGHGTTETLTTQHPSTHLDYVIG